MNIIKINIKRLSELSGYSPATVSNALNGKKGVNRETADKILRIAAEKGYLAGKRIDNIRLVLYKKHGEVVSETPFFSSLILGIEKECREKGFNLLISHLEESHPDFEVRRGEILSDAASAVLLLATEMGQEDLSPFYHTAAPVVALDGWVEGIGMDAVLINNTDAVLEAVRYLIKMGHRRIGHLKSSVWISNFQGREMGYQMAMASAGIPVQERDTVLLPPTMDGAYREMSQHLDGSPSLPTAYFADNDIIALGALKAFQEHGIRVPEQVSLIGFDDMPFCEISSPPLTTIRVYKQEIGAAAVRCLVERIHSGENRPVYGKIQICTTLVERNSVRLLAE